MTQAIAPQIHNAGGASIPSEGSLLIDAAGNAIDSSNPLQVAFPGSTAANPGANPATVGAGQKKIAATGTAVALAATTPLVNGVIVTALDTNSAKVAVGAAGVTVATDGTGTGYVLAPGQSISFGVTDFASVFINGQAGDGVSFAGN